MGSSLVPVGHGPRGDVHPDHRDGQRAGEKAGHHQPGLPRGLRQEDDGDQEGAVAGAGEGEERRRPRKGREDSKDVNARFGLTAPQLWVLWELGRGGPASLGALAQVLQLHPSTLVGVVDRLEAKGLALREMDPPDARRIRICLTPKARALLIPSRDQR